MAYTKVKTPIVYYGGKTSILNHTQPLFPQHNTYTEVFFGGGADFFAKKPAKNETINDRLDIVVNFYRVFRDPKLFPHLQQEVNQTLIGRKTHQQAWELIKAHKHGKTIDPVSLAWAFWQQTNFSYMNKIGGGYKFNNDISVSVPKTLQNRKRLFTKELAARLENAHIECEDALKVLRSRNVPGAFHRLDPPYPGCDMGHYKGYTWADYKQLLKWCGYECKGKFLLSNYNSRMLDVAIRKFGWHKKEITHQLKSPRNGKTTKTEVLVYNYPNVCNTLTLFDYEN